MSRRDRPRPRPIRPADSAVPPGPQSRLRGGPRSERGRSTDGRDGVRRAAPATPAERLADLTLALVPLRLFLGATFLYAGLDKLIDPAFLQPTGAGSIGEQLAEFVRVSPIAVVVQVVAQPFPVAIGLIIAVAEIAIGLGTLTGLLFRLSAAAGAGLSFLFWLTASWATRPYYYGPDLPYAFGWLTLALAGHGGRLVLDDWLVEHGFLPAVDDEPDMSEDRRRILQGGIIGLVSVGLAAVGGTLGSALLGQRGAATTGLGSGAGGGTAPASVPPAGQIGAPSAVPGASGTTTGTVLGTLANLASQGSLTFQDPQSGDPGVVLKLPDGTVVAYDAVCTHAGCTVAYDPGSGLLICPCHGAEFDPTHAAAVVAGPTSQPLAAIPIRVDASTGMITVQS